MKAFTAVSFEDWSAFRETLLPVSTMLYALPSAFREAIKDAAILQMNASHLLVSSQVYYNNSQTRNSAIMCHWYMYVSIFRIITTVESVLTDI